MNAGELNEIVTIKRPTTTTSDTGAETLTYADATSYRARVRYGRGYRSTVANEVVYSKSVYFLLRRYADVRNTDIIVFKREKYRILAIEDRRLDNSKEITAEVINE